jgi:hypothetical protein
MKEVIIFDECQIFAQRPKEYKHLYFEKTKDTGKTCVWNVRSRNDQSVLGKILWDTGWRRYTYVTHTFFDVRWSVECLEELTYFIKEEMNKRAKVQKKTGNV